MFAILIICVVAAIIGGLMVLLVPAKTKEERKYNDSNPHKAGWWLLAVASVLSVASFIICLIVIVPTGNVAVMVRFQKPTGEVLEQGIHSKNIVDGPIMLSIRTQLFKDDVTAASKDLQDVKTSIAINYHLDQYRAKEVYQTIGYNYIDIIANPIVQETIKEVTAKYNAEDMIIKRPEVKNVIAEALTTRLQVRGIAVESVNITNFEFSKSFTDAIESKVVAAQSVLQSQNKLLQVGVEAQQAKALAEGTADAAVARADGQAKANAILEASLTDKVLQYMFIDKMGGNVQVWVIPQNQAFTIAPDSTIKPITTATPVPKFTPVPVPTPMPSATTPK